MREDRSAGAARGSEPGANSAALAPFGVALLACFGGDETCTLLLRRDDGLTVPLPVRHFFRPPAEFSATEQLALASCHGRVLDVGAGTGGHALVLQGRGMEVEAVDISREAAEIMLRRGVRGVSCADVYSVHGHRFDTVLLLGHSVGMAGNLTGLERLLSHLRSLLLPGGQVLLDSLDVTCDASQHEYHEANRRAGRYVGEIPIQFEYAGQVGPFITWLHVDSRTLARLAEVAGLDCTVLLDAGQGEYLAKITERHQRDAQQ